MNSSVFVTGGAGFIGSHLCARYLREGFKVTAYDDLSLGRMELIEPCLRDPNFRFVKADLLDLEQLKKEIRGHELVYHLAANSDIAQGAKHTDIDLRIGTIATYNVLEAMRVNEIKHLVFASSSAIYGEATVRPTPENYGPLEPISFYGASKLACEALCTAFAHNADMCIWVYRFANIVGDNSTHGVIYDFVGRLLKEPKRLQVLGNGLQRKSYLHVSDCIEGMRFGLKHSHEPYQCYNLASIGTTEVRFIAEQVVKLMRTYTGHEAALEFGEGQRGWRGDVPFTHLDGTRLHQLGWSAGLDSDGAVRRAIQEIIHEKVTPRHPAESVERG